jgi:hypothetical protein
MTAWPRGWSDPDIVWKERHDAELFDMAGMDDGDLAACFVCMDSGVMVTANTTRVPCPDCRLGDWGYEQERQDDARMGR